MQRTFSLSTILMLFLSLALFTGCIISIQPIGTPMPGSTPTALDTPTPQPDGEAWWNRAVFYEIFVRSFYDSDGDGKGDLNGIIEKLDYLNDGNPDTTSDLGINAIWLMPIQPSPSYHGYDITDYYSINPDYGTLDDFQRLMEEAHKRGIRVIIDFVANHTSVQHPWFQQSQAPQSPYRDWYVWSDERPAVKGPWGQTVWYGGQNGFYYAVFWDGMPDLNYKNPAVAQEMDKVVDFWVNEMGIDGLRVDGARYYVEDGNVLADSDGNHAWVEHLRQLYKGINPNLMSVGEVWTDNAAVGKYAEGDEFDLLFNFDLAGAVVNSVLNSHADAARNGLDKSLKLLPSHHAATFLSNHDTNRVMSELNGDVNKAKRAATILLTLPGTPFLYYGEEIGLEGRKPDEDLRRPMQWNADNAAGFSTASPWRSPAVDYPEKNVAAQTDDPNSLLSHYRYLIALRNQHSALQTGDTFVVSTFTNRALLSYLRTDEEETLLIINNLRDEFQGDYQLSLASGPLEPGMTYRIQPIWGSGDFAQITANEEGGFDPVQLNGGINSGETLILRLVKG